jgi:hypothetical protein
LHGHRNFGHLAGGHEAVLQVDDEALRFERAYIAVIA